jgi:hypothetical protein
MKIIDDVIDNCQTTFEEDGINQRTLEDLRKVGLSFLIFPALTSHHDSVQFPSL